MTTETHRDFGNTGLQMPRVVFGATALGNLFVAMRDEDKAELVREWFANMPRPVAIDSAGKYGAGLSLEVIGRELSAMGVEPNDVVISNKLAWRRVPLSGPEPLFEPGVWIDINHDAVQDISYDGVLRCHEDGCRMLGDYVPRLVSVHDPDEYLDAATDADDRTRRLDDIVAAYRALEELRDAGEVAGVGVGAKNWRIIRELDQLCRFDWVMMANSFTVLHHPPELIAFVESLASRNIALINSAVTHGGFLVGGDFFDYRQIDTSDSDDDARLRWRQRFTDLCQQHNQSAYQACVSFAATHPSVTSLALSTSKPGRVADMVAAANARPPRSFWQALTEANLVDSAYARRVGLLA